ncbi:MAG: molybdopterin-dependent oxidoreductase [bacterium]|nr:molybdopterin-dependent oxidoreductase [bacterium]
MGQELKHRAGISRRRFLIAGTAGTASLALGLRCLKPGDAPAPAGSPGAPAPPPYGDWRDVYQERWRWDKVVRSSHFVNCWYQAHCAWNVYVKEGMVWREEQVADYPQTNASVPDPNPRGCQKGACFSERMYDPGRVRHPLKRVGPRGSGRWKRISWEQATDEVADAMLDTIEQDGSDRVIWELGPLYTEGTMTAGHQRLSVLMDSTNLDMNTEIGDGHRGAAETFGKISFERSADDYFYSDLILIWGSNPLYTQIPNAHYLTEARYKGARVVCIAPDYSASSIHSDFFVPVEPGTDAALGLSVAQVLVEEELIDRDFLVEQTDFPMLVRDDTRRLLRTADLEESGSDEELYLWDRERGAVAAPRRSLRLDGLHPELEGRFEVTLKDGSRVGVSTVFSLFRERLAGFRPEDASKICGTPPALIRKLALQLGHAKSAAMVTTSNMAKYYHGNLMERVQALVFVLTGNYGKKGSGFVGFPWLDHDSIEPFVRDMFSLSDMMNTTALKIIGGMVVDTARMKLDGYSEEMIVHEHSRSVISEGRMTSGAMFWYVHGGLLGASEKFDQWDPYLKRPVREVLEESLEKEWQYVWPKPGNDPRMMLVMGSNPLRRIRSYPRILEHLWPKLHTVVTLDFRMTSTALQSDYVLPAAGWYERSEHKWATPLMPYIHSGEKATSYYEAKSDWEIISRLAKAVDERAKARGTESFVDRRGDERPLHNLYDKYSQGGRFGPTDDEEVCADLLDKATNLGGLKWPELKKKGFARFEGIGKSPGSVGNATSIPADDTITPLTDHVFDKVPYLTLSRRMQFYLDQELYLEMGEELPVHKDPPMAGGNYPLMLTGGHARWSIHSSWRDDKLMLQQQRGEPVIIIGTEDAVDRGIRDGVQVRVFNDLDEFQIMAKVTPGVRKGQLIVYHAWENFQFKNGKGFQNLIPSPLNPVELAGGQYHLRPMVIALQPSHTDRDTRVEVETL